jgi:galactokinase
MPVASNVRNGRAVTPATLKQQLDIKVADQLIRSERASEQFVNARRAQLTQAQTLFQSFASKNSPSAADELIAERRAAAN